MILLNQGSVVKNVNNEKVQEKYTMRLAEIRELDAVVELQQYVYEQLSNKQVLYMDSYEEMYEDLENGAKVIGIYNENNRLIAYRYIGFPNDTSKNLGYDINLPQNELNKVVHLETTVVHPDYRGNGLQSLTLKHAAELVKTLGYKHLVCTVSPQNLFSLYNVMQNGLKIKALKRKYGSDEDQKDGLWRFILHRDLERVTYQNPVEVFISRLNNLEEQKSLIDNGYIGYWVYKDIKMLNYVKFDHCLA